MKFILIQLIGAIGYLLMSFSFFKKKKKQILFFQIFAYIGFAIHYTLLNAPTGSACNILGLVAIILLYFFSDDKDKKELLVLLLILILILIAFLSYENIFSIFPVAASLLTFSSFLLKDENKIRFIGIITSTCWLVYALIHTSYPGIIFGIVMVISTTIAYIKNH